MGKPNMTYLRKRQSVVAVTTTADRERSGCGQQQTRREDRKGRRIMKGLKVKEEGWSEEIGVGFNKWVHGEICRVQGEKLEMYVCMCVFLDKYMWCFESYF